MDDRIEARYAEAGRLVRVHRRTHDLWSQDQEDIAQEAVANFLGAFAQGKAARTPLPGSRSPSTMRPETS